MKHLHPLVWALLALSLASCSLYMDEVADSEIDPRTEAEGFNEPVTIVEEEFEMTYQFKDSVFVLTDRIQKYIVSVTQDDSVTRSIYFLETTPSNLLPEVGNYVQGSSSDEFPYDFSDLVERIGKENGLWRVVVKAHSPFELFEVLELEAYAKLDAFPDPENGIYVIEDTDSTDQGSPEESRATRPRRILDEIDFDSNKWLTSPMCAMATLPKNLVLQDMEEREVAKSFKESRKSFDITGTPEVSVYIGPYMGFGVALQPIVKVYYSTSHGDAAEISAGIDGEFFLEFGATGRGSIKDNLVNPVYLWGKQLDLRLFKIGFGVSFSTVLELSIEGKIGVKKAIPFSCVFGVKREPGEKEMVSFRDYKAPDILAPFRTALSDTKLETSLNATFSIKPTISVGLTLGTVPSLGFSQQQLAKIYPNKKYPDDFKTNGVSLGIYLMAPELELNLVGSTYNVESLKNTDLFSLGLIFGAEGSCSAEFFGKKIIDENFSLAKFRIPILTCPTLPKLDDNSFAIIPRQGYGYRAFDAQYKFNNLGGWGLTGGLRPQLSIFDGQEQVGYNIDNEEGENLSLLTGDHTFHFPIDNVDEKKNYVAKVTLVNSETEEVEYYDDYVLPFATRTPTISVTSLQQTGYSDSGVDEKGNVKFVYKYQAAISVKGMRNIEQWGVVNGYSLDSGTNWTNSTHVIKKNTSDRTYHVAFTLTTNKAVMPRVAVTPWAKIRYGNEERTFTRCQLELSPYFRPDKSFHDPDVTISSAKGFWDGSSDDGSFDTVGGITTDDPDAVITIDSITEVDD